ncbi:DEAD/DEAH box helicase [Carpediemonas membranifera]|uniref:RNA helicase n=1 Tax=Carpediemonas membranifera TaxID=201153 RepID=A0A8J6BXR5_9EUKA|nr:DEAD/DEAH box helicase [Carpediemonas membranifera]|eukprot:KAG9393756.1 DEAD/DEAH box helicase [Carpediemonas membranifera]
MVEYDDLEDLVHFSGGEECDLVRFPEEPSEKTGTEEKKMKRRTHGFFCFEGLDEDLVQAIINKLGFQLPSPIQRKAIPTIMNGNDALIKSRTGSGKTASFLIPIIAKLGDHAQVFGPRAIILVPTIDLVSQTVGVALKLAKCRKPALSVFGIHGNAKIEEQFFRLASSPAPDILVSTPKRLADIITQIKAGGDSLNLSRLQFLVLDEADELLSPQHLEAVTTTIDQVPESAQRVLVSATLPESLVQFRAAKLRDAEHVRLADEEKLSSTLTIENVYTRSDDKPAALCQLLASQWKGGKLLIFCCSRHHCEFIMGLLNRMGHKAKAIYNALDVSARRDIMAGFRSGVHDILVATDAAARGLDIPHLNMVINYDFPYSSKLFVHRTGRVARAGRPGVAWSLVEHADLPYLVDVHRFLGIPIPGPTRSGQIGPLGVIPQYLIDTVGSQVKIAMEDAELAKLMEDAGKAFLAYCRKRDGASRPGKEGASEVDVTQVHPLLVSSDGDVKRHELLQAVSKYRSRASAMELSASNNKSDTGREIADMWVDKRMQDDAKIAKFRSAGKKQRKGRVAVSMDGGKDSLAARADKYVEAGFLTYERQRVLDEQFLAIGANMGDTRQKHLDEQVSEMVGDDMSAFRAKGMVTRWDKKSKQYVNVNKDQQGDLKSRTRIITNNAGVKVRVTGDKKSNQYQSWKKNSAMSMPQTGTAEDSRAAYVAPRMRQGQLKAPKAKGVKIVAGKGAARQMKSSRTIAKEEIAKEKKLAWEEERRKFHEANRKAGGGKRARKH